MSSGNDPGLRNLFWKLVGIALFFVCIFIGSNILPLIVKDTTLQDPTWGPFQALWMLFWWTLYHPVSSTYTYALVVSWGLTLVLFAAGLTPIVIHYYKADNIEKSKSTIKGSAQWAEEEDLRRAVLLHNEVSDAVILGALTNDATYSSELVEKETVDESGYKKTETVMKYELQETGKILCVKDSQPEHVLCIAPTRTGKGIAVVIPTLFVWSQSVAVFDIKKENWDITSWFRSQFSRLIKLEFLSPDSARWNPLFEISRGDSTVGDAQNIAAAIIQPDTSGKNQQAGDHWIESAKSLLTGMILFVLYSEYDDWKSFGGILRLLQGVVYPLSQDDSGTPTLFDAMKNNDIAERCSGPEVRSVASIVKQIGSDVGGRPDDERGSVISSTTTPLMKIFLNPIVDRNTSASDFMIEDLMYAETPISLYLIVMPPDLMVMMPLVRLFFQFSSQKLSRDLYYAPEKRTNPAMRYKKNKLLMEIDEFPSLGKMEPIERGIGFFAGYGIKMHVIAQSLSQMFDLYGENCSIMDNCKYKTFMTTSTPEEGEKVSKYLGTATVQHKKLSRSGQADKAGMAGISESVEEESRELMKADEIGRLDFTEVLVIAAGAKPYKAKKIMYYLDDRFKSRIGSPPFSSREDQLEELEGLLPTIPWLSPVQASERDEQAERAIAVKNQSVADDRLSDWIEGIEYMYKRIPLEDGEKQKVLDLPVTQSDPGEATIIMVRRHGGMSQSAQATVEAYRSRIKEEMSNG